MSGSTVLSRNVILCTGAYFNISNLLAAFTDKQLDLTLTCQTVAYVKLSEDEAQVFSNFENEPFILIIHHSFKRLAEMPSIVTTYQKGKLDGTYILPPVRYSDGMIDLFQMKLLSKFKVTFI